jgi:ppGpp synthetase/RelA/SpoT-type nucleotidyltranferase
MRLTATVGPEAVMDPIASFIAQYVKAYDFYDQAARIAARRLESALQAEGIRCIVTSRAKNPQRLEEKVHQRNLKKRYKTVDAIYDDIVDLAGVRVALYFPGESEQVGQLITRLLDVQSTRPFNGTESGFVGQRFRGYSAMHYRVRLPRDTDDLENRYASANIEVQVASVLMHAWSEVEHDLVYKPHAGRLSDSEYALLDQLNGLVMAGEIGLEQVQRAGKARVAEAGRPFGNHFELAAHILSEAPAANEQPISKSGLGRVDLLFELLVQLELSTADALRPYLDALHGDLEKRPLAEQVIDSLLAEDPKRYEIYSRIRASKNQSKAIGDRAPDGTPFKEVGYFLTQWLKLEQLLREVAPTANPRRPVMPSARVLQTLGIYDDELAFDLEQLRHMRNSVVHGVDTPPALFLREAGDRVDTVITEIMRRLDGRGGEG